MKTFLTVCITIVSILLTLAVMLQESKSDGLTISGGADQLFTKRRARTYDVILHRGTIVLSAIDLILVVILIFI